MSPLFISFGPELTFVLIAIGVASLIFVALQIGTVVMTIRAALRKQALRALIWGVVAFGLIGAVPLYQYIQIRQAETAMERAKILRDLPDFTDKQVLYVPSRGLDDLHFACADLVRLSGARAVFVMPPWDEHHSHEGRVVDPTAAIDLKERIRGIAVIEQKEWGEGCGFRTASAPDAVDYILLENHYADLLLPFAAHLAKNDVDDPSLRLRFLIAPVDDLTAFKLDPDSANLALFSTWRPGLSVPFFPIGQPAGTDIPRNRDAFERPLRQVVCKEPTTAPEPVCWPFR